MPVEKPAHVASQEYGNKSVLVSDLIRKARQHQDELDKLRAKLMRAEQSGFSDRPPEQIRAAVTSRLKRNS